MDTMTGVFLLIWHLVADANDRLVPQRLDLAELQVLFDNRAAIGGFNQHDFTKSCSYWSSSS
jgi:hypothetical protein